jgi:hypothetical protein
MKTHLPLIAEKSPWSLSHIPWHLTVATMVLHYPL